MSALVLLNIDLGELPDEPEALYASTNIANVACGGHSGDEVSMRRAVRSCISHDVRLGAHPSYPDREGFGRIRLSLAPQAIRAAVAEQCARLAAIARTEGARVAYVKAHGALYHAAREEAAIAQAVVAGAVESLGTHTIVIGPPTGALADAAAHAGLAYAREGFADRATRPDGTLVPRTEAGALILDPKAAAARALDLVERGGVETICVHGDSPGAVAIADAVRQALHRAADATAR